MVVFTSTQVETILGKLTNGRKFVQVDVTIADSGVEATEIVVKSLSRIVAWTLGLKSPATDTFVCADGSTGNTVSITPSADSTGDILSIFAVGV